MSAKKVYEINVQGAINGDSSLYEYTGIILLSEKVSLKEFGGFETNNGDNVTGIIQLCWGDDQGGWEHIHSGTGQFETHLEKEFTGDGVKKFRVTRTNKSQSSKDMSAWIKAVKI